MFHAAIRATLLLALAGSMFGQKTGGATSSGGGGGTGGGGGFNPNRVTSAPGLTTNNPNNSERPTMAQPNFVSGRVTLDDGEPASESVIIQKVCGNRIRDLGYTDGRGRFSVNLNKANEQVIDVSDDSVGMGTNANSLPSGSRNTSLFGCDLRASLAGFRSDSVNLSTIHSLDNADVGTVILHRLSNVQGLTISATSALAPKDARKAYEKGMEAVHKQKWDEAQKDFSKAVELYPKYALAWNELGRVEQRQDATAAKNAYKAAIAADSHLVSPYLGLAVLAQSEQQWQLMTDYSAKLIQLNPVDFTYAYLLNAIGNYQLNNFPAAERSAEEGQKLDKQRAFPKFDHIIGLCLANRQNYSGASEHLKNFLAAAPNSAEAPAVKKQLGQIEAQAAAQAQPVPSEHP